MYYVTITKSKSKFRLIIAKKYVHMKCNVLQSKDPVRMMSVRP